MDDFVGERMRGGMKLRKMMEVDVKTGGRGPEFGANYIILYRIALYYGILLYIVLRYIVL